MSCRYLFSIAVLTLLSLVACSPAETTSSTLISPTATSGPPTQTLTPSPTNTLLPPSDTPLPPTATQTPTPTIQPTATSEPTLPAHEVLEGIAYANTDPAQTLSIYLPQSENIKPLTLLVAGGEYYPLPLLTPSP